MKKILIATTALVATAGIAQADITVSGSAGAGLQYNSEGATKTQLFSKVNIAIDASGETDGGLSFGFNTNHIVEDNGDLANDDTTVYMSGAFGKLSFGAVGEADEVAGLSDIGWDGLDVDDVAEAFVGDELGDLTNAGTGDVSFAHNVNYTYATGPVSFSISGQLAEGHGADGVTSYAAGVKYNFANAYVGLGYANHTIDAGANGQAFAPAKWNAKVTSVFAGGTFDAIKVAAMYSDLDLDIDTTPVSGKAYGLNVSYTMDALTISMGAGQAKLKALGGSAEQTSFGVGASYDLGGGAKISGGIARIKDDSFGTVLRDENAYAIKETRADLGVSFSF